LVLLNVEEVFISGGGELTNRDTIQRIYRQLIRAPLIRRMRPLLEMAARVAEVPGRLSVHVSPVRSHPVDGRDELTIISANLWHDWPRFRRIRDRLEAFARLVERHRANVLLLQEVARTSDFRTDHWLAERLGMSFVYSRANGHQEGIGFEEGVAILSRFPLNRPVLQKINRGESPFVHRVALGAEVDSPMGSLMAFSVHLGIKPKENLQQVHRLREWVNRLTPEASAVVGGDFNAEEGTRSIHRLKQSWQDPFRRLHPLADGTTHQIRWPWGGALKRSRLDYIFLKPGQIGWEVSETKHLETPGMPHSDHRAVLLRMRPKVS
jgi:endonuclease/exonuclease/phosphatase family metal-dependent hydrolase